MRRVLVAATLVVCVAGCGSSGLHYNVDLRGARAGDIEVALNVTGAPRDSLVLRGYGTTAAMRLSGVSIEAPGSLGFVVDSLDADHNGTQVYRLTLRGPLPPNLVVRYHVWPAAREGGAHTGWTGQSFGDVSEHATIASGRSLFLVPIRFVGLQHMSVQVQAPAGWDVVTPWLRAEDG